MTQIPRETPVRILIVEDEPEIARSLELLLSGEGFDPTICTTGESALDRYSGHQLLLLDLMLPGISGFEVLQQVREANMLFPVIILSARSDEEDIVKGLSLGADDYVTKPFSIRELVLRIRRTLALHRYLPDIRPFENRISFGDGFWVDFSDCTALTTMGPRNLTAQETAVLRYLMERPHAVCTRAELLENTWGVCSRIETRTVDNFFVRFRKYFEVHPRTPRHFLTLRARGYMFSP